MAETRIWGVALTDPLPAFRLGAAVALLELGVFQFEAEHVGTWPGAITDRIVIHTLLAADDWTRLTRLATLPGTVVVALLPELTEELVVRGLSSGAVAVVQRDISPGELRDLVLNLLAGRTVVSIGALRRTPITTSPPAFPGYDGAPSEVDWLRMLANGSTVKQVADRAGYSERMMFRLLRDLYGRLGVRGRVEAILLARKRGWL